MNFLTNIPRTSRKLKALQQNKQTYFEIRDFAVDIYGKHLSDFVAVFCEDNARLTVMKMLNPNF